MHGALVFVMSAFVSHSFLLAKEKTLVAGGKGSIGEGESRSLTNKSAM